MGRFYKTSAANPMDYMYRIPAEMMMKVMQGNEMQIQNILNTTDLYNNTLLKVPHLTQDSDYVKEKQKYYNDKTTGISKAVLEDPLSWRKYQAPIKDIGRELQEDMLTGDLSKIQGSYNALQSFQKKYEKDLQKGLIDRKEYEAILNSQVQNYEGVKKLGKSLSLEDISNTYNMPVYFEKLISKMKADGELNQSVSMGEIYKVLKEDGWEGLKKDKVMGVLYNKIMGDPALWSSINQRVKYNVPGYQNIYDKDGILQVMKPIKHTRQVKGPDGKITTQEYTTYEPYDNILSRAFFGTVDGASYMKTKNKDDIDYNPTYLQQNSHRLQLERDAIQNNYKIEAENRAAKAKTEEDKIKIAQEYAKELMDSDNAEDVKVGKLIYEGILAGKSFNEITQLPTFLSEIDNPDNKFEDDLSAINSNRKLSDAPNDGGAYITAQPGTLAFTQQTRLNESLSSADKKISEKYGNHSLAAEYTNYIKTHLQDFIDNPEELAKTFLEKKGVYQNNRSHANNTRWLPGIFKSDEANQWDKVYDIGKFYKKAIDTKYQEINRTKTKADINPIDDLTDIQIRNMIKETPQFYSTIDIQGNPQEMRGQQNNITKVLGVTGGNSQSNMGYYVRYASGKRGYVFPKNDPNVIRENMYYAAKGLKTKGDDAIHTELNNYLINDVKTTLMQGTPVNNLKIKDKTFTGQRNIISLGGVEYPAILHNDGQITLIDEDGTTYNTYPNIETLVQQSLK